MPSLNKLIIIGHMVRDPELRTVGAKGTACCNFSVAVTRRFEAGGQKKEEVAFIDCVAWAKTADAIAQYLRKGEPILIEGHLKQEHWEDKQGGGKRSKLVCVVGTFQFLSKPAESKPEGAQQELPVDDTDSVPF